MSKQVPEDLKEILEVVATMPNQDLLKGPLIRLIDKSERRQNILTLIQESLAELRVDLKYLMFDLEATRRERDRYKQQLEK